MNDEPLACLPMLTRVVRMTFRKEEVPAFLRLFDRYRALILASPGCTFLSLHHDLEDPAVLFTISRWEDAAALERYRSSELFLEVWRQTKVLFAAPAMAWSLKQLREGHAPDGQG
ncbi:MAG: hypothetical protein RLY31_2097 [Bacteroidota bacterium]